MCGIVGYVGQSLAIPRVMDSLQRLEYRGYDSAGVAFCEGEDLKIIRKTGKLGVLKGYLEHKLIASSCALGHTRWATHGEPSVANSHPHCDEWGRVALVHNGIIENYDELKKNLQHQGVVFRSQTDTEVIAQLLAKELEACEKTPENVLKSLQKVCAKLKGSYALAILIKGMEDVMFAAKHFSPLIIGKGAHENYIASDIPAILSYTDQVLFLDNDEFAVVKKDSIQVYNNQLELVDKSVKHVELKPDEIMLGEFDTFMEKEISQGTQAIKDTIVRLQNYQILEKLPHDLFCAQTDLHILACGTALHAGMVAKYLIERYCRLKCNLDYASEFRYKDPILNDKSVCIFISQSGETADTLACLDLAKQRGAFTLSVTNVPGSRIATSADFVIPTCAGPEIAVASTKAYIAQLAALYYLTEFIAHKLGYDLDYISADILELNKIPDGWNYAKSLHKIVKMISEQESVYYIGRGLDYFLAMEGALKLKEISYIHCEAFAAGELKHGSLALITPSTYVLVILTQTELIDKTLNAVHELKSRGAKVILLTQFEELKTHSDYFIKLPKTKDILMPFVAIKPLQSIALDTALKKKLDPDKPRNLAKSVTVE